MKPPRWLRPAETDRGVLLTCLTIPLLLAVVALILAVSLTIFGAPKVGTLRSMTAGIAYVYLSLGLVWLPAYLIGTGWFWWATRNESEKLFTRLYTMPLIAASFVWFPMLVMAPMTLSQRFHFYPTLALSSLVTSYVWIGFVRLIFYIWRRK